MDPAVRTKFVHMQMRSHSTVYCTTPSWFEGDDLDRLYERCAPLYELLQQATPRNSTSWGKSSSKHLLVHVPMDMMSQFEGFQYWITMVVMDSSGVHSESD